MDLYHMTTSGNQHNSRNHEAMCSRAQELDVDNFLYLYTLYVVKGRTVTPLLRKLFLGELHRYYSGYNFVRIPFEETIACSILRPISEVYHTHGFIVILFFL